MSDYTVEQYVHPSLEFATSSLEQLIRTRMKFGWVPIGGIAITATVESGGMSYAVAQAIVKTKD